MPISEWITVADQKKIVYTDQPSQVPWTKSGEGVVSTRKNKNLFQKRLWILERQNIIINVQYKPL